MRSARPSFRRAAVGWVGGASLLLASAASGQEAEVYLEVKKWDFFRVPLLVEDFSAEDLAGRGLAAPRLSTGALVEDLLAQDLELSDAFQVVRVARGALPDAGLLIDTSGRPVDRSPQASVAGDLRWREGEVVLEARLTDLGSRQEVFRQLYPIAPGDAPARADRWEVHRLADAITRFLTAAPGCAATRIAFISAASGSKEIHLIDWDGFGEAALTRLGSILVSPAWHPAQPRIACTSFHAGQPRLVSVDLGSGAPSTLAEGSTPSAPAFSRDGRWIAYSSSESGDAEIYIARSDGAQRRRITFSPGIDTAPSWSPSGDRLAFTSDRAGRPQLFVTDADGASVDQLTFGGEWNDSPDWSPLSDRVVHVCRIEGGFELAIISAAGLEWRRLTRGGGCENPRWAPDGRHVVFARMSRGDRQLWILDVNSGRLRQLTAVRGGSYNPAWSGALPERLGPVGAQ